MKVDTSIFAALSFPAADDSAVSIAQGLAQGNRQKNLAALRNTQLLLTEDLECIQSPVNWVFGRDGSLTGLDGDGKWLSGCSLPRRAAGIMVEKLRQRSAVGCLLFPQNGWQIEQTLRRLGDEQAIIVIIPDMLILRRAIYCCDYSADIAAHRLWLATGDDWPAEMSNILQENPGLPLPQQFIRLITLPDDPATELMRLAQKVFNAFTRRRTQVLLDMQSRARKPQSGPPKLCVLAPGKFALWQNAGVVLAEMVGGQCGWNCQHLKCDDPRSASNLALALAAAESAAVVTANLARVDFPGVLPAGVPVVSWITGQRMPPFTPADERDQLLVADRRMVESAVAAGWPKDRVALAGWPRAKWAGQPPMGADTYLAILADTRPVDVASEEFALSSHQLLWEMIEQELRRNPFVVEADPHRYLEKRMDRLGTDTQSLDRRRFVDDLIGPLYTQGLAQALMKAGLPLRLFGHGWEKIDTFAKCAAGPIVSQDDLEAAAAAAAALVYTGLGQWAHPIDSLGCPVVHPDGRGLAGLIDKARQTLAGRLKYKGPDEPRLEAAVIGLALERAGVGVGDFKSRI